MYIIICKPGIYMVILFFTYKKYQLLNFEKF